MNVEEILSKAINCLMDRRLSNAIEVLEQLYVQRPSLMGHSEFEAIKTHSTAHCCSDFTVLLLTLRLVGDARMLVHTLTLLG